jgi:hypothetical protein
MMLAHYFPGLDWTALVPELRDPETATPELTRALLAAGEDILEDDEKLKFEHTKVVAQAAGARIR